MGAEMVVEGLVAERGDGPCLIGSRCSGCGTLYFPQTEWCRNPGCKETSLAPEDLPREGTLYSYTIQRYQPPPLFRMDDWEPYVLGVVEFGEGVQAMGMLTGVAEAEVAIGMRLRTVIETLYRDDDRGPVATYKFAPVEKKS